MFKQIPVVLPRAEILRRMGHNRHHTLLTVQQDKWLEHQMQEAFALCHPAGVYRMMSILENDGRRVVFGSDLEFSSSALCNLLAGCDRLALLAVTVGTEASELAGNKIAQGLGAEAIVCDATASETADAAMDWLCAYLGRELPRTGGRLTANRFSPGYGDLTLEAQETVFRALQPEEIGMALTASRIMLPEKSVTAIAGIGAF